MSSPLAIAGVTAMLKDLLNNGLFQHDLSPMGSFSVTAMPPDRVETGQNEPNQLNLFLYQVTPNQGWRNQDLPGRDASGVRLSNPPLALDLHYLLTAYGSQDLYAEILLGYAMFVLHETPVLTRAQLQTVLASPSPVDGSILPPAFQNLPSIDLADQVEILKISPVYLSTEELSKIWTAMQARYRPTMAYLISVVLIQGDTPTKVAPPVLQRGAGDTGPTASPAAPPYLTAVRPAISDMLPAMRLGDDLVLTGAHFKGAASLAVNFENAVEQIASPAAPPAVISDTQLSAHVPSIAENANAMNQWAIGTYSVSLTVTTPSSSPWSTNTVPISLSPLITVSPLNAAPGAINLTVTCTPRLLPDQEPHTQLVFGSQTVDPASIDTPADPTQPTTLTFTISSVAAGTYVVRLRVEGIDSLPLTIQNSKFSFDPNQKVVVA
jgi:hypothetical protein